jgi:hypothetical protein
MAKTLKRKTIRRTRGSRREPRKTNRRGPRKSTRKTTRKPVRKSTRRTRGSRKGPLKPVAHIRVPSMKVTRPMSPIKSMIKSPVKMNRQSLSALKLSEYKKRAALLKKQYEAIRDFADIKPLKNLLYVTPVKDVSVKRILMDILDTYENPIAKKVNDDIEGLYALKGLFKELKFKLSSDPSLQKIMEFIAKKQKEVLTRLELYEAEYELEELAHSIKRGL